VDQVSFAFFVEDCFLSPEAHRVLALVEARTFGNGAVALRYGRDGVWNE
jgi:hypothetical protein